MKFNKSSLFKTTGITGMVVTPTGLYIDSLLNGRSLEQLFQSKLDAKDLELQNKNSELSAKDQELADQKFIYTHDLKNKNRTIRALSDKVAGGGSAELEQANQLIDELTTERDQADAARAKLSKDYEESKTKWSEEKEELQDEIIDLQEEIHSKNKAIKVSLQGIADREKLIALLKQQVIDRKETDDVLFDYMFEVIVRQNMRIASDDQHFNDLYTAITDMSDYISKLHVIKDELEASVKVNNEDLQRSGVLDSEVKEIREELTGLLDTLNTLRSQLQAQKALNDDLKRTVQETMGDEVAAKKALDDVKDKIKEQEAKIKWYEEKSDKDADEINRLKNALQVSEGTLNTWQPIFAKYEQEKTTLADKIKNLQGELQELAIFKSTAVSQSPHGNDNCTKDVADPSSVTCKGLYFWNPGSKGWTNDIKKLINQSLDS